MTHTSDTPTAFRPIIRLISTAGGVDPGDYLGRLVAAFVPHVDADDLAERVAEIRKPTVPVVKAEEVLSALPADVSAQLRKLRDQADATARYSFAAAPDALVTSSVTVVDDSSENEFAPGTVVWERLGEQAHLQFVLPRLVVDTATGAIEQLEFPVPTMMHRVPVRIRMSADSSVRKVAESAAEVASSVSWALPPPWNVGVTGALSILQIVLRATDQPEGPSPLEQLETNLEKYIAGLETKKLLDQVRLFSEDLMLKTNDLTFQVDQVASMGPAFAKRFDDWSISPTGIDAFELTVTSLLSTLESADSIDAGKDDLTHAVTALTVWTTGQKIRMQLAACRLGAELAAGNASGLTSAVAWRGVLHEIQDRLFGLADDSNPHTTAVAGWVDRVETWINAKRTARLVQIHPIERTTRRIVIGGPPDSYVEDDWGWRFVDDAENNQWAHWVGDTTVNIDSCHSKQVPHPDVATAARATRIREVSAQLDSITSDATTSLRALREKVQEIASLQAPEPPKTAPTVTLHTSGTPTPSRLWVKGAEVSYAVAFANDHGPSQTGPWSESLEIGDFVGATLTNLPQDRTAPSIHLVRRIVATPGAAPVDRNLVPVPMGTATVEDIRDR